MTVMRYLSTIAELILITISIGCKKSPRYAEFPIDGVVSPYALMTAVGSEDSLSRESAYLHIRTPRVSVIRQLDDGRMIAGDGTDFFIIETKTRLDVGEIIATGAYLYTGLGKVDNPSEKDIELPCFSEIDPIISPRLFEKNERRRYKVRYKAQKERMKVLAKKLSLLNFNLDEMFHFQNALRQRIIGLSVWENKWDELRGAVASKRWLDAESILFKLTGESTIDEAIDKFYTRPFHLRLRLIDAESISAFDVLGGMFRQMLTLNQFSAKSDDVEFAHFENHSIQELTFLFSINYAPYYIFRPACRIETAESELKEKVQQIEAECEVGNISIYSARTMITELKKAYQKKVISSPTFTGCYPRNNDAQPKSFQQTTIRCVARYSDGNRCREMVGGNAELCHRHRNYDPAHPPFRLDEESPTNDVERVVVTKRKLEQVRTATALFYKNQKRIPTKWIDFTWGLRTHKMPPQNDAWGNDFKLTAIDDGCVVSSAGIDGKQNTQDDIQVIFKVEQRSLAKMYAELSSYENKTIPHIGGFQLGSKKERPSLDKVLNKSLDGSFYGMSNVRLSYEGAYDPRLVGIQFTGIQTNYSGSVNCKKIIAALGCKYGIKMRSRFPGDVIHADYSDGSIQISIRNVGLSSPNGEDIYVLEVRDNYLFQLMRDIDKQMSNESKK